MNQEARNTRAGPGLLVAVGVLTAFAGYMFWAQNFTGRDGGPISVPKAIWLSYALLAFYVVPWFFLWDRRLHAAIRGLFFWHLVSWFVRGAVELYLMYGIHRWIPPYGVYHGFFNLALLAWLSHRVRPFAAEIQPSRRDSVTLGYLNLLRATQVAEMTFAILFWETTGHDTSHTWFASDTAPFCLVNWLTAGVEVVLLPWMALTIRAYYQGLQSVKLELP